MDAKEQAIADMLPELYKQGKCFIAFITRLDPIMNELVNNQIKEQETKSREK